jgi:hypothetical protein
MTIYRLKADKENIRHVQEATQATEKWGIEPTHGLFGSQEWWQHIHDGTLPVHRLKGTISRLYMDSMNNWPEFTLRSESGKESGWSRYANEPEFAGLYTVGRPIEIDYVTQRHCDKALFDEDKIPIEIRVAENA